MQREATEAWSHWITDFMKKEKLNTMKPPHYTKNYIFGKLYIKNQEKTCSWTEISDVILPVLGVSAPIPLPSLLPSLSTSSRALLWNLCKNKIPPKNHSWSKRLDHCVPGRTCPWNQGLTGIRVKQACVCNTGFDSCIFLHFIGRAPPALLALTECHSPKPNQA